jgi:hypothetical protein
MVGVGKGSQVLHSCGDVALHVRSGVSATEMHASMAIDREFRALALSEATPLDHHSEEFKSLHRYFHQSLLLTYWSSKPLDFRTAGRKHFLLYAITWIGGQAVVVLAEGSPWIV